MPELDQQRRHEQQSPEHAVEQGQAVVATQRPGVAREDATPHGREGQDREDDVRSVDAEQPRTLWPPDALRGDHVVRLMPRRTLISAQSTTGQRAISSSMPRQESLRPEGWNHRRDQRHIRAPSEVPGGRRRGTARRDTGDRRVREQRHRRQTQRTASETDHSVYQL